MTVKQTAIKAVCANLLALREVYGPHVAPEGYSRIR